MGITLHLRLKAGLVDLVEYQQPWHIGCSDLVQNLVHLCNLGITLRARGIHHMQKEVCMDGFFQRGTKRSHQSMWKIANEPNGIGHGYRPRPLDPDATRRGVKRGKELVSRIGVSLSQGVEECRLAGVGVPDEGNRHDATPYPGAALSVTLP